MDPTTLGLLFGGGAAISGASSILGGLFGQQAAGQASSAQTNAGLFSAMLQMQMFNQANSALQPYYQGGANAFSELQNLTGTNAGGNPLTAPLTTPFQPTMAQLAQTPGYQFALNQGLQATQNSYAAQGLGQSGAALKGAANYAEGLASTTYQQQFQNYLAQNAQIASIIGSQVQTGEQAAGALAGAASNFAPTLGSTIGNIGAAQASGYVGGANALTGAATAAGGAPLNAALLYGVAGNLYNKKAT